METNFIHLLSKFKSLKSVNSFEKTKISNFEVIFYNSKAFRIFLISIIFVTTPTPPGTGVYLKLLKSS